MGELDVWRSVTQTSSQDDANVRCWGNNYNGQLGYGDTSNRGAFSNGACPPRPARNGSKGRPRRPRTYPFSVRALAQLSLS